MRRERVDITCRIDRQRLQVIQLPGRVVSLLGRQQGRAAHLPIGSDRHQAEGTRLFILDYQEAPVRQLLDGRGFIQAGRGWKWHSLEGHVGRMDATKSGFMCTRRLRRHHNPRTRLGIRIRLVMRRSMPRWRHTSGSLVGRISHCARASRTVHTKGSVGAASSYVSQQAPTRPYRMARCAPRETPPPPVRAPNPPTRHRRAAHPSRHPRQAVNVGEQKLP